MTKAALQSVCVYCGNQISSKCYDMHTTAGDHFNLLQCHQCHTKYLSPHPSDEQLALAYNESYYGENEEKFEGFIEKLLDSFRKKRAGRVAKAIGPKGKVLDVGCGNGRFLQSLKSIGDYDIHGIEMEGKSASRAERVEGLTLKKGQLESNDFNPESLDAVTMFHVYEHLANPAEVLDIVTEIIKPGGVFMASFPNIDSRQAKLFKGNWLHLDPPRHLSYLSPIDFTTVMEQRGFKLVRATHFSIEYNPFGYQQSLLNGLLKQREVLFEYLKGNTSYTKAYSSFSLMLQKLFYLSTFPLFIVLDAFDAMTKRGGTVELIYRKVSEEI